MTTSAFFILYSSVYVLLWSPPKAGFPLLI
jgi:hypothetical protein